MNQYFVTRQFCPSCDSKDFIAVFDKAYDDPVMNDALRMSNLLLDKELLSFLKGVYYTLLECRNCGLVFQKEIPTVEMMEHLYKSGGSPDEDLINPPSRNISYYIRHARQIMGVIQYFGKTPSVLEFLDFGMGWGEWCGIARGLGCRVSGTELSKSGLDNAKKMMIPVIQWDEIPEHKFDFINLSQVLEHLASPYETLAHLKRGVKQGGIILIGVPNGRGIKRRLKLLDWNATGKTGNSLRPVWPLWHINCFTHQALVNLGTRAGFERVIIPDGMTSFINQIKPYYKAFFRHGTTVYFRKAME